MPSSCGTALVTGAGKRIGRVIAERLAEEGFALAIHYRGSREDAAQVASGIVEKGGHAAAVEAELSDVGALPGLVREAATALSPLTLLVNCASVFGPDTADSLDPDLWERNFAVNLRAPAFLAKAFAAQLPADRDGAIVNIIDQRVLRPTPQAFSYTLTKAALWTATRTMAQAFAPRIRVNGVGPGPTLENNVDGNAGIEKEARNVLLRRPAPPADVADAVIYLVNAKTVTGQMIAVDSGQHLGWRTPDIVAFDD